MHINPARHKNYVPEKNIYNLMWQATHMWVTHENLGLFRASSDIEPKI